ncbi:hypothetical protein BLNAU_20845 [Blattamonas nauphoetae]|uniref:Uncharacterized protein n=1 Tax=Blattamonas nauphoetae TaxID=2049346 RepID=A0ABQ9WXN1_9EUKA|nr:hypothetical protein BLNAU_20845 [Blattamonas nauphoetae]
MVLAQLRTATSIALINGLVNVEVTSRMKPAMSFLIRWESGSTMSTKCLQALSPSDGIFIVTKLKKQSPRKMWTQHLSQSQSTPAESGAARQVAEWAGAGFSTLFFWLRWFSYLPLVSPSTSLLGRSLELRSFHSFISGSEFHGW